MDQIPELKNEPEEQGKIPTTASELPEEEAPESEPVSISFSRYNAKECQLDGLEKEFAKDVLRALRDIGTEIYSIDEMGRIGEGVKDVVCDGDYRHLFKHLDDIADLEVKEIVFNRDGRLFFFMVDRMFYFIAVKQSHIDTSHSRGRFRKK